MKINEVEQLLGISKANIRFYEKQQLLNPDRAENGYREYSQADIERLQTIIVMRKLGISVQNIGRILNGELSFQDAIRDNIKELEAQMEQLEGALELSRRIAAERDEILDTQRYWDMIQKKEAQGERFADVAADYWSNILQPIVFRKFALSGRMSVKRILLQTAVVCALYALARTFLWKEGNLLANFFYWTSIILLVAMVTFPIFWLGKHHPKIASVLNSILLVLCVLVLGGVFLILIIGLAMAIWNSVF